jgi:uncharacterized protein YyaL (SSP411 family)
MTNRLARETSPYLLQHAENPVDWYPWGEEAFARARAEDRPVLLSVGYAACHWCHVMEHESFENPAIAQIMNDNFVSIKVDREERPDIDAIYMQAVQALTGNGGWPMTVFLTPDAVPFYGGTYFPPEDRGGMPGFPRVLTSIAAAYRDHRPDVLKGGEEILGHLHQNKALRPEAGNLTFEDLDAAAVRLLQQFDARFGGFGQAPKFPQPMSLEFLMRCYHRTGGRELLHAVEFSLRQMAAGGIYDHLGGGFHRYSTDARWLVPHFEKMLYDNAQLSRVYLQAFQVTGDATCRRVVEETLDYVLREMTGPEGGFYSTQDADSEGVEGKFFVWTPAELQEVLGDDDAALVGSYFDVSERGNFEGKNILNTPRILDIVADELRVPAERLDAAVRRGRQLLFERREQRVHPGLDDKVLTAWNGLMLRAFAEAARVLERDDYRDAALRNAAFLQNRLYEDGRLLRSYRSGRSKLNGYLEDYAFLSNGLLSLYEATFETRWFTWAEELARTMIEQFADEEQGGFFDTAADHESLILRPKDFFDNATPSGNSAAAEALLRLAAFTGDPEYAERALAVPRLLKQAMVRQPTGFGRLLCAADFALAEPKEVAIIGWPQTAATQALIRAVFRPYLPNKVVAGAAPDEPGAGELIPLLEGRIIESGRPLAYVCQHFTCQLPVSEPEALAAQLGVEAW